MRCHAKVWKDTGLTMKSADIELKKEYCVRIKSLFSPTSSYKKIGRFISPDGVEVIFVSRDSRIFGLDRITKVYEQSKLKEDKPLFDNKKVQMYERYKRSPIR